MLGGNDRFGTCGPTYVANSAVLTWHYLLGEDITVTDEQIWDLYRRSGNPDFDPEAQPDANGNVPGDGGVDMTVMLSELVKNGIAITHADGRVERVKPLCFAAHDTGIDTVRAVTSIFGADGFGLDLSVAQQAQTRKGVWDYVAGAREWGGHATLGGAYTSDTAAGHADETNVTWQLKVGMTDAFIAHQLAEGYAVVWEPLWDHPAFQAGIDQAALAADFTEFTGRQFPVPVPPQPAPDPAPVPVPQTDPDLTDFARAIPARWPSAPHTGENKRAAHAVAALLEAKGLHASG